VNGTVRRNLEFPVRPSDRILVDDAPLIAPTQIYLMMNNPGGLVITVRLKRGCATDYSLLSPTLSWMAPVGPLDKASEGLLLFTNDWIGPWAPESTRAKPEDYFQGEFDFRVLEVALNIDRQTRSGMVLDEQRIHPV